MCIWNKLSLPAQVDKAYELRKVDKKIPNSSINSGRDPPLKVHGALELMLKNLQRTYEDNFFASASVERLSQLQLRHQSLGLYLIMDCQKGVM